MLALIAAGRGGGGDSPTFYTVPWSPMIVARGGQIPGHAYANLLEIVEIFVRRGIGHRLHECGRVEMLDAMLCTGHFTAAIIVAFAVQLAAELEMVPQRRSA